MSAFGKALGLGLIGLVICIADPSSKVALFVTVMLALIGSWRALKRWL